MEDKDPIDQIFEFDRRIRFCGLADATGKLLSGGMRTGIRSLEPSSEQARLLSAISVGSSIVKSWEKYYGSTNYFAISQRRVIVMIFPLSDYRFVLVSAEPTFPPSKIPELGVLIDRTEFIER